MPDLSPLGRYDAGEDDGETFEVHLLAIPVELFMAARQQHDELMREFAVMALAHRDEDSAIPAELRDLIREMGVNYARSTTRADDEIESAVKVGVSNVDLVFQVSKSVLAAATELEELMASADDFCRSGRMLTMPRSPQILRFTSWWLEELRRQIGGLPAMSWTEFDALPIESL